MFPETPTPIDEMDMKLLQLVEPAIVSFSGRDDLSVWQSDRDGDVVIRIGPAKGIGAETIEVPAHLVGTLARTLMAIVRGVG